MRVREATIGDVTGAVGRHRHLVAVVAAVFLIAVLAPGEGRPRTEPSHGFGVSGPGGATDASPVDAASPGEIEAGDQARPTSTGFGRAPVRGGVPGAAAGSDAVRLPAGVVAAPDCDAASGRLKVPTVHAPPCAPAWKGPSTGPTTQGVSGGEITVVVYLPQQNAATTAILTAAGTGDREEDIEQSFRDYADLFGWHHRTYGRAVKLVVVKATGRADDDTAAKADAIKVATEIRAFASIGLAQPAEYIKELAARGVLVVTPFGMPIDRYLDHAPLVWSAWLGPEQIYIHAAEYVGKRLWGRNARWSGSAVFRQQRRTFGLVHLDSADGGAKKAADFFTGRLAPYGAKLADRIAYTFDPTTGQEQARTVVARLKDRGVTSVLLASDPLMPVFFTKEATRQQYFPEWVILGTGYVDTTTFGRTYDTVQWASAFGLSSFTARVPQEHGDSYKLHVWHHNRPPKAINGTYRSIYDTTWLFFTGVHLAGPTLTPSSFAAGLNSFPPSGGALSGGLVTQAVSFGSHGMWPWPDYIGADDMTELWWDPEAQGEDNLGKHGLGMYMYVDGGRRYLPGQWPAGEPAVFDRSRAVDMYESAPPQDVKTYEHRHN